MRELRVDAQGGQYLRVKSDDIPTEQGNPKTVWQREAAAGHPVAPADRAVCGRMAQPHRRAG